MRCFWVIYALIVCAYSGCDGGDKKTEDPDGGGFEGWGRFDAASLDHRPPSAPQAPSPDAALESEPADAALEEEPIDAAPEEPADAGACEAPGPAPRSRAEIEGFIQGVAARLDDEEGFDLDPIIADIEDQQIFFFGEVHGSRELTVLSAALLARLVREGRVDSLALEIGFDMTSTLQRYVDEGSDELEELYGYAPSFEGNFVEILVEQARVLALEGHEIKVFAVNYAYRTAYVVAQIEAWAADLDEDLRALVLGDLPEGREFGRLSGAYMDAVDDYYEAIQEELPTICAKVPTCDLLEHWVTGMWLGANILSGRVFERGAGYFDAFLATREAFIHRNVLDNLQGERRAYINIGAAHAAMSSDLQMLGAASVASRLDGPGSLFEGAVYALRYANGPDSEIYYGGEIEAHPSDVPVLSDALEPLEGEAYFVPARRHAPLCVENPLLEWDNATWGTLGESFDGFVYVEQLSPAEF